jgi:integrase
MARKAARSTWGSVRKLPSGRFQARYTHQERTYAAPFTFQTKMDAGGWLTSARASIIAGTWVDPDAPKPLAPQTFREYATGWLEQRDIKPRTRQNYQRILDQYLLPEFGDTHLTEIDTGMVRRWHSGFGTSAPAMRVHSYALLRNILGRAVDDEILTVNPARIRGAGTPSTRREMEPATVDELQIITDAMPGRLRLAVQLAAWTGARQSELLALTRDDIDVKGQLIRIRRGVTRTKGEVHVLSPKSRAGTRTVHYPPHLEQMVRDHLRDHVKWGKDSLLFEATSGGYLGQSALYYWFDPARRAAGRRDLRWHDLRHFGATAAARAGATLGELQARLGHASIIASMRYQHSAQARDKALAEKLSEMAAGNGE